MSHILDYFYSEFCDTAIGGMGRHFSGAPDNLTVVLKGHLIVEKLMRDFCSIVVPNYEFFEKAELNFQKLTFITRSLIIHPAPHVDVSWLWGAVNSLNRIRNIYAHHLEPESGKLEKELEKFKLSLRVFEEEGAPEQEFVHRVTNFISAFSGYLLLVAQKHSERAQGAVPPEDLFE